MAISTKAIKQGGAPKPATITEDTKAQVEAEVASENPNLGKSQGDIEFMYCLGNQNDKDTTPRKEGKIVTPRIVGYVLKNVSDHDITVPDCGGLGTDAKQNRMSYKEKDGTRVIKPGQEFDVTAFEVALLISQEEYNGVFAGGDASKHVTASYVSPAAKSKGGLMSSVSTVALPTVSLKLREGGSLKDGRIEPVILKTEVKNEDGTTKTKLSVAPGYEERYGALATTTTRSVAKGGSRAKAKDSRTQRNANASRFLKLANALPNRQAEGK